MHRALADPLRIRLLEYLIAEPRSAKELAGRVGMPPDRLYHHLSRLQEAGLIQIAEYRPLPAGKVERVYAAVEVEPPGDDHNVADAARFFDAVIEATRADLHSALLARDAGARREINLARTALRLPDRAREELFAGIQRLLLEASQHEDPEGTWTRFMWTLVDAEDRQPADHRSGERQPDKPEPALPAWPQAARRVFGARRLGWPRMTARSNAR